MYFTGMISILAAFIILVLGTYWLLYPYKIIEVKKIPATVITKTVKVGDMLSYEVDYCKYKQIPAEVTIEWVDDIMWTEPSFITNNPSGCFQSHPNHKVPVLPAGAYHMHVIYKYQPNPIRTMYYEYDTESFQIIK